MQMMLMYLTWGAHFDNHCIRELKFFPGHTSGKDENSNAKRYLHPNVHCSTMYNSQGMEAT